MLLHCFILYVPAAALVFSVVPLSGAEWGAVFWLSFPVILVDELLKYLTRCASQAFFDIMLLFRTPHRLLTSCCLLLLRRAHWRR
jgi:hypothetical protein